MVMIVSIHDRKHSWQSVAGLFYRERMSYLLLVSSFWLIDSVADISERIIGRLHYRVLRHLLAIMYMHVIHLTL